MTQFMKKIFTFIIQTFIFRFHLVAKESNGIKIKKKEKKRERNKELVLMFILTT